MKEKKDNIFRRFYYGLWKENPILFLCLGLCPVLAVSTTAEYALAMGAFTTAVRILTTWFHSLPFFRLFEPCSGSFRHTSGP